MSSCRARCCAGSSARAELPIEIPLLAGEGSAHESWRPTGGWAPELRPGMMERSAAATQERRFASVCPDALDQRGSPVRVDLGAALCDGALSVLARRT